MVCHICTVTNLAVQRMLRRPNLRPGLHPVGFDVARLMHRAGCDTATVEQVLTDAMAGNMPPHRAGPL